MKDPRCWMYARHNRNKLLHELDGNNWQQFEDNQRRERMYNLDWFEYMGDENNTWDEIDDHTRVKRRQLNPKTAMFTVNPKSHWKGRLDGIYDRHEHELDGHQYGYYSKMVYYRGAPDAPYWPPNERPITPVPRIPTPEPPKEPTPVPPTPTPEPPKEPTPIPPTPTPTPPPREPTPPPKEPTPVPPTPTPEPPKEPTPIPPTPTPTPPPREPTPPPKEPTPVPPTPTPEPPKEPTPEPPLEPPTPTPSPPPIVVVDQATQVTPPPTPPPKEPTPVPPTPTPPPPPKVFAESFTQVTPPPPTPTPTPPPTPTPEPPKEPTPEPPKEPTPVPPTPTPEPPKEPTPLPTPEPQVSPLKGAYLYKLHEDGRWRIGPDYEKEQCWFFTKGTEVDDAQFYTADKDKMTLHRSNIAVTKLEGMNNVYASSVRDSTDAKYKESGRLERDERENFIGSWVQIKDNVYVHGPINTEEETVPMTIDQAQAVAPVKFEPGSFTDAFKQSSLTGTYDKVGENVYRRREPSMHENKDVWAYRVQGRWAIGSKLHSNECWAYSKTTEKPMHQIKHWYEARIGEQSGKVNRTNADSFTNKFETNKDVVTRA